MKTNAFFVILAGIAITGCATEDNLRLSIGHSVPLQALPPVVPDQRDGLIGSADHDNIPGDQPSFTGLDRSHLATSEFRVPIDGTFHYPHNTFPIRTTYKHARQRGEFPTTESVLEQSDMSAFSLLYEFIAVPAWSIIELAWLAPALIIDGPWETASSPQRRAGRTNPEPKMLVPGIITLTRAELDDLENAASLGMNDETETTP